MTRPSECGTGSLEPVSGKAGDVALRQALSCLVFA